LVWLGFHLHWRHESRGQHLDETGEGDWVMANMHVRPNVLSEYVAQASTTGRDAESAKVYNFRPLREVFK
jgi:hypothetical protein